MANKIIPESLFIPYESSDLPHTPWLVLAPHPDDETFGMGGSILKATDSGHDVDVAIITNGAQGGKIENITKVREEEARKATTALGCRNIYFLNQQDRLLKPSDDLINHLSQIILKHNYGSVFFPSPVEPHPDHRVTAHIGWEAIRRTCFTSQPISYEISTQGPCNMLIDTSKTIKRKIAAMGIYESQLSQNNYIDRIIGLNTSRTWSLPLEVTHAEAFFAWPKEDIPLISLFIKIQLELLSKHL